MAGQWGLRTVGRRFLDAWRATRVSVAVRHGEHDLHEIVNGILYQSRTGCQWAYPTTRPWPAPPSLARYDQLLSGLRWAPGSVNRPERRINDRLRFARYEF